MKYDMRGFKCKDCKVCTHSIGEYYMVTTAIWRSAFGGDGRKARGMLCIGCLERRIGRNLARLASSKCARADFPDYPINHGAFPQSDRLMERIAC